ncbi:MAG TPA: DUF2784 domain-containing protein [Planctomycetota bacterium]|nr:DUF2784 domain-containing protein [Planctomycetota bacterium]
MSRALADAVVVVHFAFVAFVVCGGFLALAWPRLAWIHVPVALWGAAIEFGGWICPLTPLENRLRQAAGEAGYSGGFVEHYLLPTLYPEGLTRGHQLGLGAVVLAINAVAYALLVRRTRRAADRS